jgi:hypothetical protein
MEGENNTEYHMYLLVIISVCKEEDGKNIEDDYMPSETS